MATDETATTENVGQGDLEAVEPTVTDNSVGQVGNEAHPTQVAQDTRGMQTGARADEDKTRWNELVADMALLEDPGDADQLQAGQTVPTDETGAGESAQIAEDTESVRKWNELVADMDRLSKAQGQGASGARGMTQAEQANSHANHAANVAFASLTAQERAAWIKAGLPADSQYRTPADWAEVGIETIEVGSEYAFAYFTMQGVPPATARYMVDTMEENAFKLRLPQRARKHWFAMGTGADGVKEGQQSRAAFMRDIVTKALPKAIENYKLIFGNPGPVSKVVAALFEEMAVFHFYRGTELVNPLAITIPVPWTTLSGEDTDPTVGEAIGGLWDSMKQHEAEQIRVDARGYGGGGLRAGGKVLSQGRPPGDRGSAVEERPKMDVLRGRYNWDQIDETDSPLMFAMFQLFDLTYFSMLKPEGQALLDAYIKENPDEFIADLLTGIIPLLTGVGAAAPALKGAGIAAKGTKMGLKAAMRTLEHMSVNQRRRYAHVLSTTHTAGVIRALGRTASAAASATDKVTDAALGAVGKAAARSASVADYMRMVVDPLEGAMGAPGKVLGLAAYGLNRVANTHGYWRAPVLNAYKRATGDGSYGAGTSGKTFDYWGANEDPARLLTATESRHEATVNPKRVELMMELTQEARTALGPHLSKLPIEVLLNRGLITPNELHSLSVGGARWARNAIANAFKDMKKGILESPPLAAVITLNGDGPGSLTDTLTKLRDGLKPVNRELSDMQVWSGTHVIEGLKALNEQVYPIIDDLYDKVLNTPLGKMKFRDGQVEMQHVTKYLDAWLRNSDDAIEGFRPDDTGAVRALRHELAKSLDHDKLRAAETEIKGVQRYRKDQETTARRGEAIESDIPSMDELSEVLKIIDRTLGQEPGAVAQLAKTIDAIDWEKSKTYKPTPGGLPKELTRALVEPGLTNAQRLLTSWVHQHKTMFTLGRVRQARTEFRRNMNQPFDQLRGGRNPDVDAGVYNALTWDIADGASKIDMVLGKQLADLDGRFQSITALMDDDALTEVIRRFQSSKPNLEGLAGAIITGDLPLLDSRALQEIIPFIPPEHMPGFQWLFLERLGKEFGILGATDAKVGTFAKRLQDDAILNRNARTILGDDLVSFVSDMDVMAEQLSAFGKELVTFQRSTLVAENIARAFQKAKAFVNARPLATAGIGGATAFTAGTKAGILPAVPEVVSIGVLMAGAAMFGAVMALSFTKDKYNIVRDSIIKNPDVMDGTFLHHLKTWEEQIEVIADTTRSLRHGVGSQVATGVRHRPAEDYLPPQAVQGPPVQPPRTMLEGEWSVPVE